jgi:hypothetical protein
MRSDLSHLARALSISAGADRPSGATVMPRHAPEDAMKYLCLVYHDEQTIQALPQGEYEAIMGESLAYREEMRRGGRSIAASSLEFVGAAATIRVWNGRVAVTAGPFAEAREQLSGFYLLEARDLNEAIRLAAQMPPARLGSVEVRPIKEYPDRCPDERA